MVAPWNMLRAHALGSMRDEDAGLFDAVEHVMSIDVDVRNGFHLRRLRAHGRLKEAGGSGCVVLAAHQPGISRTHPVNLIRINMVLKQPDDSINSCLSAADNDITRRLLHHFWQVIERYHFDPVSDFKIWRTCVEGTVVFNQVASTIFSRATTSYVCVRRHRGDLAVALIFAHWQISHATGGQKLIAHHLIVIGHDFRPRRQDLARPWFSPIVNR